MKTHTDKSIMVFLQEIDRKKDFFHSVDEVNKYNLNAIIELIQYDNIKNYGDPLYTRHELRKGIKQYLQDN
ncbi:hypothetical protein Amet_1183 [Alkaliphilus metalliredigens QYMF]|uniref:Uncharacterized protein n=1 Tax=Alkaliphilus metalliredigens (strain QYMF) TaxID=293826 RepID=A6TMH3_ALKMQ|nr:hypothetical protein [Alkaliphilus metalliredigens]ABR47391.1 hypothetical protein Amet_1183 [Alkaliphilus metalliredigens QYMF]